MGDPEKRRRGEAPGISSPGGPPRKARTGGESAAEPIRYAVRPSPPPFPPPPSTHGFIQHAARSRRRGRHRADRAEFETLLAPDEPVEKAFQLVRDLIVFTDRRIVLVDKQGVTGKKREYLTLPYKQMTRFSVETAGRVDLDSDVKVWVRGHGAVRLELPARRGRGRRRPPAGDARSVSRRSRHERVGLRVRCRGGGFG